MNVCDSFPEYRSKSDSAKAKIEIRHLLTMTSGIDWPQFGANNISDRMGRSRNWIRFVLDRPMASEPGTVANHSNGDAHLVSAILQEATGESALEFGWKHLFQPMGIADVRWDYDPNGISIGSATLYLAPQDMAKLGYLYLNGGIWEGKQILSSDWIHKSLQRHSRIKTAEGLTDYGFYWWIHPDIDLYEAWGGSGQRIGIFTKLGIVVVMTANIADDSPVTVLSSEIYHLIERAVANPSS